MDGVALMAALCAMEGGTPVPAGTKDDSGTDGVAADVGVEVAAAGAAGGMVAV